MIRVLDACCAGMSMYHSIPTSTAGIDLVTQDIRQGIHQVDRGTIGTRGRSPVIIRPRVLADFRDMPYRDSVFDHVVFDPPHYTEHRNGQTGTVPFKYGALFDGWPEMLYKGFREAFRVLRPGGTLVFKWNSTEIPLPRILSLAPHPPLYGHHSGKTSKTHWLVWVKEGVE